MTEQRKIISVEKIKQDTSSQLTIFSIRVKDSKNDRFTDCYLTASVERGKVKFTLIHERGYPTENKGVTSRSITGSWVSNKLPLIGEEVKKLSEEVTAIKNA